MKNIRQRWLAGVLLLLLAVRADAGIVIIQQVIPYESWQVMSTVPTSNAALDKPPSAISITFSQVAKPEGSFIKVYDPYNNLLETGDLDIKNTTMSVDFPPPKSGYIGTYRVIWQATCACADTKVLNDTFYFSIH